MARSIISSQAVGAYGEKVVEAELLRRGWLPSNVNASVKNAAKFDIFAQKGEQVVCLQVKTCGPGQRAFQFHLPVAGQPSKAEGYLILVSMGRLRDGDEFWVVPSAVVQERLLTVKVQYLQQRKRDGGERKDTGQWTLWLDPLKRSERNDYAYGVAKDWVRYRDNWDSLKFI
jgi:hypothetical protein